MKKILALLLSLSMCMSLYAQVNAVDKNHVLNGDFSQGTENWEINKKDNTDGTIEVLNQELKFVPINCNGNYWELGFKQANIQLKNGVKYRLSFEAKASEETNIKVTVENQENWTKRLNDTDTWLTQDYKMYTFEFNVSDDGLSQLVYHIGENSNNNKEYFFKNISITEIPVQKLDSWILNEANGVSGTLSGTEDKVQVKINAINGNWWDLTLKKDNIELQPKKMYKVNFDVISSMDGTMSFDIENTNDYNIKALDRTLLDLKTGKNQFEFNFIKKNTEKESLAFHLSSGDGNTDLTNANITIENIKFTELEDLGNEYVFNGGFENGIVGWEFYNNNGADLKISAESQEGVLTFDSSQGNDYWDAQFFQKDIMLDNGVYEVSFDIKANQDGKIKFNIQDTSDYNLKYLDEQELNLTADYQTMKFKFSIKSNDLLGTTKNAKIQFDVGKYNDFVLKKIYIDNVKIEKIGNVDVDDLEKGEVHFDVNDIITKDFKGLGVQWDPYQVHPLTDEEWNMVCERVDYLNPSFIRLMIYATTYCNGLDENNKPIYDFESDDMKALIRELDYLESRNIEVVLGEWEAPDRFKGDFSGVTVDSPLWAEMISGLMDYLINEKGYTCIKYFNYVNEANTEWSYCQDYSKWEKGIGYLYNEFEKIGILDKVQITGPDTVWDDGHTWLKNLAADVETDSKIGLYDVHMYPTIDEITNGKIEDTVKEQRSIVEGKDFYMTEIGMVTGKTDGDSQPYVKKFSYGVIMADAVSQVMRGGLSGVAIWDMDDAMHNQANGFPATDIRSLKQWGFWNSIAGRVYNQPEEENIRPHFYTWSLMTHLFPRHSSVVNATWTDDMTGLRAVGIKTKDDQMTYMIVNNSNTAKEVKVFDNDKNTSRTILEYRYFDDDRVVNSRGYPVIKDKYQNVDFNKGVDVSLPSGGVVFLTTIDTDTMATQGQVKVHHVDATSGEAIIGAKFEILDSNGETIKTWESSKENYAIKGLIPSETYTIKQILAPKGYIKMQDVKIKGEDYMNGQILTTKNKRVQGQVLITVLDQDTKNPLENVEYVLKDINGNILEILKTDSQGKALSKTYDIATFKDGQYDKTLEYVLVESHNISSYKDDKNQYKFEFVYVNDQTEIITSQLDILKQTSIHIEVENNSLDDNNSTDIIQTDDSTMFIGHIILGLVSIIGILYLKRKKEAQ